MLPYCAMAGAIIALRWVWDARRCAADAGLWPERSPAASALGFALFASNANQVLRCDALTPVWLTVMIAAGTLLFALSLLNPANRWVRLALAAAAGGVIVAGFALLFPQCLGRPEQAFRTSWRGPGSTMSARRGRSTAMPFKTGFPIAALPVIGMIGALVATWRAAQRGAGRLGGDRAVHRVRQRRCCSGRSAPAPPRRC